MIDCQEKHSTKRNIIRIISWILLFTFSWNQIAYAGDFLSFKPAAPLTPRLEALKETGELIPGEEIDSELPTTLPQKDQDEAITYFKERYDEEEAEITNYDIFNYRKGRSGIDGLLPSPQEQESTGTFAPAWLKKQREKSEGVIRQKEVMDNLVEQLLNRRRDRDDVELPLKKKSGGEDEGPHKPFDYSLTDPDDLNLPHNFNEFINPKDLQGINKYDITMMQIAGWMAGARQEDDDDGVLYWLGRGSGNPGEDRLVMKILYIGSGDSRKIDKILTGYRLTESGKYEA